MDGCKRRGGAAGLELLLGSQRTSLRFSVWLAGVFAVVGVVGEVTHANKHAIAGVTHGLRWRTSTTAL